MPVNLGPPFTRSERSAISILIHAGSKRAQPLEALRIAGLDASQADVRGLARSGIMHLKLAVIDREVIIMGSYNWTDPAERRNKEILEIKRSREYAERLIGEIEGIR